MIQFLGTSVNDVGGRVPSSAPTTYLFELFIEQIDTKINQKWLIFSFAKNHPNVIISNILMRVSQTQNYRQSSNYFKNPPANYADGFRSPY